MDEGQPEADVTAAEQDAAENHIRTVLKGLVRAARSERAHGKFHRGWQSCGMCHAVKLGLALVAAMDDGGDEPSPEGEPVIELPQYEERAAAG